MFAQSLGDYGALGSFGSSIQSALYSIHAWLGDLSPGTWGLLALVLIALVVLRRR
jgi:MYXO-CTERM domain-containing protein